MQLKYRSSKNCKKISEINGEEKNSITSFIYWVHLQFFEIFSILSEPFDLKNTVDILLVL